MKRKLISAAVAAVLTVTSVAPAVAAPTEPISIATRAEARIPIIVDDIEIFCDQPPVIVEDRTLVPLRAIFEALGAEVYWDNDARSVTVTKEDTTIFLAIGSLVLYKNGEATYMDVPGQIINDRTMVPVRAVSESFGAKVYWDNDTRTVRVYTEAYAEPEEPSKPENPGTDEPVEPENPNEPSDPNDQIDESENAQSYKEALDSFSSGDSYKAYYQFDRLGDYKDSKEMKRLAKLLNHLIADIHDIAYDGFDATAFGFQRTVILEYQIGDLITQNQWLVPVPYTDVKGAGIYTFNSNGSVSESYLTNSGGGGFGWSVSKGGLCFNKPFDELAEPYISKREFIKITDDVYINYDHVSSSSTVDRPSTRFFINTDSSIGRAYKNYWQSADSSIKLGNQQDNEGIYIPASVEGNDPDYPDPVDNAWKQAYIDYINNSVYNNDNTAHYKLVDINGDAIPELYTSSLISAYNATISTYYNGEVVDQWLGVTSLEFLEGKNLLKTSGGHMDHYYDYVYRLNGGRFEKIHSGEFQRDFSNTESYTLIYNWDGRQVSETEYNAQLNQVINPNLAISPWDNTTYDSNTHRYVGNGLCNKQEIIQKIRAY